MEFYNEKLKKLRKQKALGIKYIIQTLNIGRSTYWNWENKVRTPSEDYIVKLAKIFNISVSDISDLKETKPNDIFSSDEMRNWENFTYDHGNELVQAQKNALIKLQTITEELSKVWSVVYGMIKSLKSIVYIKDMNSKYILANDAFKKNLGLMPSYKVSGKKDYDFYPIKEAEKIYSEDYKVLFYGKDISGKVDIIPGTRKKKIGLVSKHPILNHKGEISGIICSYDDISELKELEKDKSLLIKALKASSDIITIIEEKTGNIVFVSDSVVSHTGYSKSTHDKIDKILNSMHPDDRENNINTDKIPDSRQFRIFHKNGNIVWFDSKRYFINYEGKSYICNIARNITEEKNTKKNLTEYKQIISEKLRDKGFSEKEINEIL